MRKSLRSIPKANMYDPPEGWRYGFPKRYSPLPGETLKDTLLRDGYPEKLVETAIDYTRFWLDPTEPQS